MYKLDDLINDKKYNGCDLDSELLNKHLKELKTIRDYKLSKDVTPK